jgi:hypothetical protein
MTILTEEELEKLDSDVYNITDALYNGVPYVGARGCYDPDVKAADEKMLNAARFIEKLHKMVREFHE